MVDLPTTFTKADVSNQGIASDFSVLGSQSGGCCGAPWPAGDDGHCFWKGRSVGPCDGHSACRGHKNTWKMRRLLAQKPMSVGPLKGD